MADTPNKNSVGNMFKGLLKKKEPDVPAPPVSQPISPASVGQAAVPGQTTNQAPVSAVKPNPPVGGAVKPAIPMPMPARLAEAPARQVKPEKKNVEERAWQAAGTHKVNLINDQVVLFVNWQEKILVLILSIILALLFVILAYEQLLVWEKTRNDEVRVSLADYNSIKVKVARGEADMAKITEFNRQLTLASFLIENHIHWTNLFKFLEIYTMKNIYYESFDGKDLAGDYILPAVAKDLYYVPIQIDWFKKNSRILKANTGTSASDNAQTADSALAAGLAGEQQTGVKPDKVKFDLELIIDPKIFIISPGEIKSENN